MELREKVAQLPTQPGVYLYKDGEGTVLYVGKANSIRKRVASHFAGKGAGRGSGLGGTAVLRSRGPGADVARLARAQHLGDPGEGLADDEELEGEHRRPDPGEQRGEPGQGPTQTGR